MRNTLTAVVMAAAASLSGGAAGPATAADRLVTPQEGMVFSATSPAVGDCTAMAWYFRVGPKHTLTGMVSHLGTEDVWRAKGTYTDQHTFHVDTQELTGQLRTGSVDGQVMQNGALSMEIGNVAGGSPCANKTVYIPWFRDGNAFDPTGGAAGGGG